MSRCATWLVSSFSFESSTISPDIEVSARPKLLEGVVTQLCTSEVMLMTTNCSAAAGVNEATSESSVGSVAYVTVDSLQAPATG
jgi:hypothetical protein